MVGTQKNQVIFATVRVVIVCQRKASVYPKNKQTMTKTYSKPTAESCFMTSIWKSSRGLLSCHTFPLLPRLLVTDET